MSDALAKCSVFSFRPLFFKISTGLPVLNERYWGHFLSMLFPPEVFGLSPVAGAFWLLPLEKENGMANRNDKPTARGTSSSKPGSGNQRPKQTTKKDQLIRLLRSKRGMDIAAISTKLAWQHHTTRAALTRLRQAGFELVVVKGQGSGPGRYRIASDPPMERLAGSGGASDA